MPLPTLRVNGGRGAFRRSVAPICPSIAPGRSCTLPPMRILLPLLMLLIGCPTGEVVEEIVEYTTADTLVDHSQGAEVGHPRVCVSGTAVFVVWHDNRRGGRNQVFMNIGRQGGTSWREQDILISSDDSTGRDTVAENPEIACAGDQVFVLWEDDRESEIGHRNIYFANWDDNVDVREFVNIRAINDDPDGDYDAITPAIAVDYDPTQGPDRDIYMTWTDNRFGAHDVWFTRSVNGYNFLEQEIRLDTDDFGNAYSARPQILSDEAGGVYVAWEDSRDGGNDVYVNRSRDFGFNWEANDTRVDGGDDGGGSNAFGVTLAVDREADVPAAYVAWHDERNGGRDIFLNYSLDAGDSWQPEAVRIDGGGEGAAESFYPSVVASDGRVVVAWHDDRDVGFDIQTRGSDDGGVNWGPEQRLDTDLAGSAHSLGVKLVGNGDTIGAVWTDRRQDPAVETNHPDIYFRTSADGGYLWSDEDGRIDDDPQSTGISDEPQVALAGPLLHVVWLDYRSGNADLWYRNVPADGPIAAN